MNVFPGERVQIPVLLHNDTNADATVTLAANGASGFNEATGGGIYLVPARQTVEIYVKAKTPAGPGNEPHDLTINAEAAGASIAPITITVHPDRGALPQ